MTDSDSPAPPPASILFVDDDPDVLDAARDVLLHLGYDPTVCRSGPEALKILAAATPDFALLITDLTMPRMDGLALARVARDLYPDLPIILCTGYAREVKVPVARQAGVTDFYVKPLAPDTLGRLIRNVLDDLRQTT